MGTFIHKVNGNNPIQELEITYCGELASKQTKLLTVSAVIGVLRNIVGVDNANIINALPIAKTKGISVKESSTEKSDDYSNMIELKIKSGDRTISVRGTVFGDQPRLVGYNEFTFDVPMSGDMIFLAYKDEPGIIGAVGSVLGANRMNVAQMAVGRSGRDALMVITVDQNVSADVLAAIGSAAKAREAKFVDLVDN
jgi:D-3-phosphoglycerate dehydrogenase / 2-oxoglutarate reductase